MGGKQKRGTSLGFKIFDFYLSLGIKHAYALLYFVALHYLLFDRKAVAVSAGYVKLRFDNPGFFARLKHIYRLFVNAGKNLIDLRMLERDFSKVYLNPDTKRISELLAEGDGVLLLTAHIGNWQVMMRNLPQLGAKVNIVMLPEENHAVREFLQIDTNEKREDQSNAENFIPRDQINIIDPTKGADAVLEIVQELTAGNIVSMMADAVLPDSPILISDFFGGTVTLSEGPFRIATATKSPVICLLPKRNAACDYAMDINEITVKSPSKKKKENIQLLADRYAGVMVTFLKKFPYEWSPAGKL